MPRVHVEFRTGSKENYKDFCKKNPNISIDYEKWKNIVYSFNENFKLYILETGEKVKLPFGFGEFSINKKKRKKYKVNPETGQEFINLPVDWKKTKEKGKIIYNFNFHTEGYFFGWMWFKPTSRLKEKICWYFKPSRTTSRIITHYLNVDEKYKDIYREWQN